MVSLGKTYLTPLLLLLTLRNPSRLIEDEVPVKLVVIGVGVTEAEADEDSVLRVESHEAKVGVLIGKFHVINLALTLLKESALGVLVVSIVIVKMAVDLLVEETLQEEATLLSEEQALGVRDHEHLLLKDTNDHVITMLKVLANMVISVCVLIQ
jgi:hypothetical protein